MDEKSKKLNKIFKSGFLTFGSLRDILIITLIAIVGWKLLNTSIAFDGLKFNYSELLSILLAFFAIALSAIFYFKATETSNSFYDNTYKFTKEVSEILGRIESGFGEKLRHIDEGYTGLRDKFEKIPFDIQAAKDEEKKEEKHIKEQEKEMNRIILELMEKAKVADDEKEVLLKRIEQYTKDLDNSRIELRKLQRKISMVESDIPDIPEGFIEYLASMIEGRFSPSYSEAPTRVLKRKFRDITSEQLIKERDIDFMHRHGLLDEDGLTAKGAKVLRLSIRKSI